MYIYDMDERDECKLDGNGWGKKILITKKSWGQLKI